MIQSNEPTSESGASCGVRLKQAREQAGLTHENVAARLKIPTRVIRQLESGDVGQLGAPVFVRGQLRSYARLLGIDLEDELSRTPVASVAPPTLVSHTHTPRYRRVLEQTTRRAIYIVMTAAIAVPVWLATRPHLGNQPAVQSLDVLPEQNAAGAADAPATLTRLASTPQSRTPLAASMAPISSATASAKTAAPADSALVLEFTGDSWIQVYAPDGKTLEQGVLGAGEQRSYAAGEVARVVLGNTAAVQVLRDGKPVDLEPFSRAKVARFTLSSDGSLAPVAN